MIDESGVDMDSPRLWIYLFKLALVGSNWLSGLIKYQEPRACCALINRSHEGFSETSHGEVLFYLFAEVDADFDRGG